MKLVDSLLNAGALLDLAEVVLKTKVPNRLSDRITGCLTDGFPDWLTDWQAVGGKIISGPGVGAPRGMVSVKFATMVVVDVTKTVTIEGLMLTVPKQASEIVEGGFVEWDWAVPGERPVGIKLEALCTVELRPEWVGKCVEVNDARELDERESWEELLLDVAFVLDLMVSVV